MLSPLLSVKGSVVEPGLIDVEDALALLQQVQHCQSELLPEHQVPLRVALEGDRLDLAVLQQELATKDLLDEGISHLQSMLCHHCMFDNRRLEDVLLGPQLLKCLLTNSPSFEFNLLLSCS